MSRIHITRFAMACLMSLAIAIALVGCGGGSQPSQPGTSSASSVNSTPQESVGEETSAQQTASAFEEFDTPDWASYCIRVEGSIFNLPCMLNEFETTGLKTRIYSPGYKQGENKYETAARLYKSNEKYAYLGTSFMADSEDPSADEVEATYLIAEKAADADADFEVSLPGNIIWGKSQIEDAIAVYGEPEEVQDIGENYAGLSELGITKSYSWFDRDEEGKVRGRLDIDVDDKGTVDHIYIGFAKGYSQ